MVSITRERAKPALAVLFLLALAIVASTVAAPPAGAATPTVSGSVSCSNGQPVRGVWVQSSAGGSKWASWWAFPGRPTEAYFSASLSFGATSSSIQLHVGCGGTTSSWWSTNLTPTISVSSSRTVNASCSSTQSGRRTSCTFPPKGQTTTYNQGIAGYCTWGAYDKWRAATGYYPNIGGNAIAMDDNAAAKGWRVTTMPAKRAMIVFNTGTFGHVGWVTNIRRSSTGKVLIDIVEMNYGSWVDAANGITTGFNKFSTRTVDWNPSNQRFIQATL